MDSISHFAGLPIRWFYINLERAADRKTKVLADLQRCNISAERFAAHSSESRSQFPELSFRASSKAGEIGCTLSHYDLLRQHMNNNYHVGIFEDDMKPCVDFRLRLQQYESRLQEMKEWQHLTWDIAFLSSYFHDEAVHNKPGGDHLTIPHTSKTIHRVFGGFTTHAYIVHKDSVARLVRLVRELKNHRAIDQTYIDLQRDLRCYSYVPGLCTQHVTVSSIQGGEPSDMNAAFQRICGPYTFTDHTYQFNPEFYPWKY